MGYQSQRKYGGGGSNPPGASVMSDGFSIDAVLAVGDTSAAQSESFVYALDAHYSDAQDIPSEFVEAGFSGYQDASNLQSETKTSTLLRWVTATATGGTTAPTNPTFAQAENNGAVATCKAGGVSAATSVLTCTIAAPFAEIASGATRTLLAYYAFTAGTQDTCAASVSYRQSGLGADTVLSLPATGNYLTTPASLSLTNINPTVSVVITYTHSATVPTAGGQVTIDATGIQTTGTL